MSFFATSEGSGARGGNYGGLEGADRMCQRLAEAAGSTKSWRAYLCTSTSDARDRIGAGPWVNSRGQTVARSPDELHEKGLSNDSPQHVYDEHGELIPPHEHDIVTGCGEDGRRAEPVKSCADWSSSSADDSTYVGHSDHPPEPWQDLISWNSAHSAACDQDGLEAVGGSGRLYCFAVE
jgi:hypothetical protein